MKTLKLNFTVPEDVAEALKARVGRRKRSAFVAAAVFDKLKELEQEQLRQLLAEGYQASRTEDVEVNQEWEGVTLEGWPRDGDGK
jgi:HD superfamily phosphohydrolase YqeK